MPDFVSHALAGHALHRASAGRLDYTVVMAGSLMPDLVSWLPLNAWLQGVILMGWPSEVERYFPPMHAPLLVLLWCWLGALLFVRTQRALVLSSLAAGSMAHVLMDLMQDKYDSGYLVLYPLSMRRFQIGLVAQDDWVLWIAVGIAAAAMAEAWHRWKR